MNPNKALWEMGDFTKIAATMRRSGEALIASFGPLQGLHLLDLGCGDGTTAVPAARCGAQVLGVDISSPLVAAGNRRAQAEGLANISFQEGDASHLEGLADGSFDLVVSLFGAMFAPQPEAVAREMVRVARPGGRIVMGNWIPGDPTLVAQILRISAAYAPPPPAGFISPMTWGQQDPVIERFEAAGLARGAIDFATATYTFEFNGTPAAFVDVFRTYYGPTMKAFEAAAAHGRAEDLLRELEALFAAENISANAEQTVIPARYLKVSIEV